MTKLKEGDIIYIKSFLDDNPEFYCWKHLKDLVGMPTQVTFVNHNNGIIYITHPFYDKVPFNEGCVDYEVLNDYEKGEHKSHNPFSIKCFTAHPLGPDALSLYL